MSESCCWCSHCGSECRMYAQRRSCLVAVFARFTRLFFPACSTRGSTILRWTQPHASRKMQSMKVALPVSKHFRFGRKHMLPKLETWLREYSHLVESL